MREWREGSEGQSQKGRKEGGVEWGGDQGPI